MGRAAPANPCEFIHQVIFLQSERLLLADSAVQFVTPKAVNG